MEKNRKFQMRNYAHLPPINARGRRKVSSAREELLVKDTKFEILENSLENKDKKEDSIYPTLTSSEAKITKKSQSENIMRKAVVNHTETRKNDKPRKDSIKVDLFKKFRGDEKAQEDMKKKCSYKFVESYPFQIYISLITVYALYGEDLRVIFFPKEVDVMFNYITILGLISFTIEITLSYIARKEYRCKFFFWLDVISTISMLLDISWINDSIFKSTNINFVQFSKVGRASKVGSRAGRVVRIIRLIRLLRMVKLYKQAKKAKDKKLESHDEETLDVVSFWKKSLRRKKMRDLMLKQYAKRGNNLKSKEIRKRFREVVENKVLPKIREQMKGKRKRLTMGLSQLRKKIKKLQSMNKISPARDKDDDIKSTILKFYGIEPEEDDENANQLMPKESKVGRQMTHRTIKKLVMIVLFLLMLLPLFQASYYAPAQDAGDFDIVTIATLYESNLNTTKNFDLWNSEVLPPLLELMKKNYVENSQEMVHYKDPSYEFKSEIYDELREDEIDTFTLEAYTTEGTETLFLTVSSRKEVVLTSILNICRTTLICVVLGVVIFLLGQDTTDLILIPIERIMIKVNRMARNPSFIRNEILSDSNTKDLEMVQIENAILKIGSLLMVMFGPPGAKIIASNVIEEGDLNPIMPGNKVYCIFGFCDIRKFTNATEILEEEVMVFVNEIAEIIHTTVHNYVGSSNKNIGDAFLLVWRTPDGSIKQLEDGTSVVANYSSQVRSLADVSLISILLMISRIEISPKLEKYSQNEKLCKKMPNYKVTLGFGLHCGWAIEGALGSYHKIDVTYLGNSVDLSMKLEEYTKYYKSMILLTSSIFDLFSPRIKRICRMIDKIKFNCHERPLGLYTVDLSLSNLDKSNNLRATNLKNRRKNVVNSYLLEGKSTMEILRKDREVKKLVWTNEDFRNIHGQAIENYLVGEWVIAKIYFLKTLEIRKDGPSIHLLKRIQQFGSKRPENWHGYWSNEYLK